MTKAELIEALAEYPDDATLELGKFIALDPADEQLYEVRLDYPVAGIAYKEGEIVLAVIAEGDSKPWLLKFGKVKAL